MEENYTPKPPRICPACGSAVADGFDKCPTCGQDMPMAATQAQPIRPQAQPMGQTYIPFDIPAGSTIVRDKKTYFDYYLPRPIYHNILAMAIVAQIISLLLGASSLLGAANNIPGLFIFHAIAISALGLWILATPNLASTVVTLVYTVLFFFVSLVAFDLAYWYPILAAVLAVTSVVRGNKNWEAYRLNPVPVAILSEAEIKAAGKSKRTYRIVAIVMAVVLLGMGVGMSFMQAAEEEQYEGYTVGEINGNTYTNDFANITFTLPEGWDFLTEDELYDMNDEFFGFEYDTETCAALVSADNGNEENFEYITVYVTRHEREEVAEDYIRTVRDDIEYAYGGLDEVKVECEFLDDVTLNGVTYEVLHTVYTYTDGVSSIAYDEYILIQRIGAMTFEIYIQPNADNSYTDILACFGSVES